MSPVDFLWRVADIAFLLLVGFVVFVWWRRKDYAATFKRARNTSYFKRTGELHPAAKPTPTKTHGSAHWLTIEEAKRAGVESATTYSAAVTIGRLLDEPESDHPTAWIQHKGSGHLLCFVVRPQSTF